MGVASCYTGRYTIEMFGPKNERPKILLPCILGRDSSLNLIISKI